MAALGPGATGQTAPAAAQKQTPRAQTALLTPENLPLQNQLRLFWLGTPEVSCACSPLFTFEDSDIKFKLANLMQTLRDSGHEGWVLSAYPDPKTSRPLIGAGFGLDVMASEHVQRDPLNPYPFIEPSSAQLWQAAGLDPEKLDRILDQFNRDLKAWKKKNFRRKVKAHALPPELTQDEAMRLLRVSALQSIHNARAYCRDFDQVTASQQMALSQLVFQMGVNLEEFVQFLSALNDDPNYRDVTDSGSKAEREAEHWKLVQSTLIDSDWARRYTGRAVTVIAMFDPNYENDPVGAQHKVRAAVHPIGAHRKKHRASSATARRPPRQES